MNTFDALEESKIISLMVKFCTFARMVQKTQLKFYRNDKEDLITFGLNR